MAEYASWDFPDGGRPGSGLGNAVMKVLKAVEGIDVSTECVVLMFETLWTKGARISGGSLRTRALTLDSAVNGLIRSQ